MRMLAQAGVPVGVLVAPLIPALNDMELERILQACAAAGATRAGYVLLRLPHEIKELFEGWLAHHYPKRAAHVLALVRQTRGGALYDSRFRHRQTGQGPYAELLAQRFKLALRRFGLDGSGRGRHMEALDCSQFAVPEMPKAKAEPRQMELL
jgi:DNA repair photolyase